MKRVPLIVCVVCLIAAITALASPGAKAKPKKPKLTEIVQTLPIPVEVSGETDVSILSMPELTARLAAIPDLSITSLPQLDVKTLPGLQVEAMPDLKVTLDGSQSTSITSLPKLVFDSGTLDVRILNESLATTTEAKTKSLELTDFKGRDITGSYTSSAIDIDGYRKVVLFVERTSGVGWVRLHFQCEGIRTHSFLDVALSADTREHQKSFGASGGYPIMIRSDVLGPELVVEIESTAGASGMIYGVKASIYLTR